MGSVKTKNRHLLTVLVEDYFHVGAFENLIHQRNWTNFEPRYERNTIKALDLLDEYGTKATFFVLGWIAAQSPRLVREIAERGHEVASRGYFHRSVSHLTNDEFRDDLRRTNEIIEGVTGQKVIGYRAAEKLNYRDDSWIFDVIADEGFVYDTSFMPSRAAGKDRRFGHQVHVNGTALWEFPYPTRDLGVGLMPIAGGNYFRQIPYTLMRHAVRAWNRETDSPFVSYFHVWELDPEQPRISAASKFNRIRHYRNLDKMEWVLRENLEVYDCVGIADHLGLKEEAPAIGTPLTSSALVGQTEVAATGKMTPVTVAIPCYNEVETLPYLANTLRSLESRMVEAGYSPTFLFVDDKSTDATLTVINELFGGRSNVSIVEHAENKGVAAGIMTAIRSANTEIVATLDCDCTYDPHEIVQMLALLANEVDMVTASPYHRDGGVRNVPGWRLFLSKGASFLYRRVLSAKLGTYTSCFRVYRRDAMVGLELTENGFLGVAEMLGLLDLNGGKIVEYPTVLEVRLFGFSKMKTVRTILGHIDLLSRLAKLRFFRNSERIEPSIPLEEKPR